MNQPPDAAKWLLRVRDDVEAIHSNFASAIAFHEVWKPAAQDEDLHQRMGRSYATQAFGVIRLALRREMLLALMRIWDEATGAQSLPHVLATLHHPRKWAELLQDRYSTSGGAFMAAEVASQLEEKLAAIDSVHAAYLLGGSRHSVYKRLIKLRSATLAHTQRPENSVVKQDPQDAEVEEFFNDTASIVTKLMSVVQATAIDYADVAGVYQQYARFFWSNARGERTAGHPSFRPPTNAASQESHRK